MTTPTENTWTATSTSTPPADQWDATHAIEVCHEVTGVRDILYSRSGFAFQWTHWRRVELPPLPKNERTQEEVDGLVFIAWDGPNIIGGETKVLRFEAWRAA